MISTRCNFGLCHIVDSKPFNPVFANLPKEWSIYHHPLIESLTQGNIYKKWKKSNTLFVVITLDTMEDGKRYIHLSMSYRDRIPDWETVKEVKNTFIGGNKDAFIYFPIESEYVNIMPFCLHLWSEYNEQE